MAMFEFICDKCEVIHDVLMSSDERDKELECPDCGTKLKKMITMSIFLVR